MRSIDFSSWQALLSTLFGLALITLIGVGIRLLAMATIQQRRERENRQINERLRTLIAAYKTLGGSFTGNLAVDPAHRRDLRQRELAAAGQEPPVDGPTGSGSDRARRMRDATEAALSDIILLGTEEQVRLAVRAAHDLVEGRVVHTAELVVSLRAFVREALRLDPIPKDLQIPGQGPVRPSSSGGRTKSDQGAAGGKGGGGGGGMGGMGGGMGGMGLGGGSHHTDTDNDPHHI